MVREQSCLRGRRLYRSERCGPVISGGARYVINVDYLLTGASVIATLVN